MLLAASHPVKAAERSSAITAALEGVADAAQALAARDPARAEVAARDALAAWPRGTLAARAELALGVALRSQSRFAEAETVLRRALPRLADPALADHARLELAETLLRQGHAGAAAPALAQSAASRSPAVARRARRREADALLEGGAPAAAARAYEALLAREPSSPAAPAARLGLAAALRATGDEARAVATYRALWMEHPADAAGDAAGLALDAWRAAGAAIPAPTPDEQLARAARLLELALASRVVTVVDALDASHPPSEPLSRSWLLRALALLQLGRRDEAAALALRIHATPAAQPGTRMGAELVLARVAARAGRVDEAAARYRTLAGSRLPIPGLAPARARDLPDEAAFLAAWLYYDAGHHAKAAELLHAYARHAPRARRADDARWFEAWSLHRLGRRAEARKVLARLGGPLLPAALYWQARWTPDRDASKRLLRRAAREAPPGSWYALLASARLAAVGERAAPPELAAPGAIGDGPGSGAAGEALARASTLLGAGLRAEALEELRALAAGRDARDAAARVAQIAEAAGDSELPFRVARDLLTPTRRALRWLYPRAYADLLDDAAARSGVDPFLYLAIMRRESAFRPDARSSAGAVGLVQLIPPTAERLAQVYGLAPEDAQRLEEPQVSVPLGAAYLGLLMERFRDPAAVLAAYNAGPAAVAAWARAGAGLPLDEWAERVPFRETRRYVKTVTADLVMYGALWGGRPLALDPTRRVAAPGEGIGF